MEGSLGATLSSMTDNTLYWQENDSFDWLGDDPSLYEYERTSEENLKGTSMYSALIASIPRVVLTFLKLGVATTIAGILVLKLFGTEILVLFGVPLFMWVIVIASSIGVHVGSKPIVKRLIRIFQLHPQWSLTELPGYLEAIAEPLRFMGVVVVGGGLWMAFIPPDCSSYIAKTPFDVCYYEYAHRFIYAVGLIAMGFMTEKIVMQRIRSSFHRQTYGRRIVEVRFKRFVVERLSQIASVLAREQREASSSRDPLLKDNTTFRRGQPLSYTAFDTLAYETIMITDLDARRIARDIFHALCPSDRKHLTPDDLSVFGRDESNAEAFSVFDTDGDGSVSRSEFRNAVMGIFSETRNLARSIKDGDSALDKLDRIFLAALLVILGFLLLAVFKLPAQSILSLGLSTAIALNVFIGDSIKKIFENIIFIFLHHPYDVGDTVLLSTISRDDSMMVRKIHLANTEFQRWNGEIMLIANNVLFGMQITNISRSHETWERIEFKLHISKATPESIYGLRKEVFAFLSDNSQGFFKSCDVRLASEASGEEAVGFYVKVQLKPTNDSVKRWQRRLQFKQFMEAQTNLLDGTIIK